MTPKVKVFGERVLVNKKQLDAGGLKLTPAMEQDGYKNTGTIVAVGNLTPEAKVAGIKVGATIYFHKFFIANTDSDNELVFVDIENILGIEDAK